MIFYSEIQDELLIHYSGLGFHYFQTEAGRILSELEVAFLYGEVTEVGEL